MCKVCTSSFKCALAVQSVEQCEVCSRSVKCGMCNKVCSAQNALQTRCDKLHNGAILREDAAGTGAGHTFLGNR